MEGGVGCADGHFSASDVLSFVLFAFSTCLLLKGVFCLFRVSLVSACNGAGVLAWDCKMKGDVEGGAVANVLVMPPRSPRNYAQ
jgi:hypothetical protein